MNSRDTDRQHEPIVADAEPLLAQSVRSSAARPLPPPADTHPPSVPSLDAPSEHLAAAVERKLVAAQRVVEARRRYKAALDGDQWSLSGKLDREIAELLYELECAFEEQPEQPRGGNVRADGPEDRP